MILHRLRELFSSKFNNYCGAPHAIDAFLCKKNLLKLSQKPVRIGVSGRCMRVGRVPGVGWMSMKREVGFVQGFFS